LSYDAPSVSDSAASCDVLDSEADTAAATADDDALKMPTSAGAASQKPESSSNGIEGPKLEQFSTLDASSESAPEPATDDPDASAKLSTSTGAESLPATEQPDCNSPPSPSSHSSDTDLEQQVSPTPPPSNDPSPEQPQFATLSPQNDTSSQVLASASGSPTCCDDAAAADNASNTAAEQHLPCAGDTETADLSPPPDDGCSG